MGQENPKQGPPSDFNFMSIETEVLVGQKNKQTGSTKWRKNFGHLLGTNKTKPGELSHFKFTTKTLLGQENPK